MKKTEMVQLRLEGFTYAHIAKQAGVSRQRIQQLISPPKAIRDYVVNKYGGHCIGCRLYVGKKGHVHHEGSTNGEDYNDVENLVLLCISCHGKRHRILSPNIQFKASGTLKRNQEIILKNLDGVSMKQLAEDYNLTPQRISAICSNTNNYEGMIPYPIQRPQDSCTSGFKAKARGLLEKITNAEYLK